MAQWEITGEFFESCNCNAICPCITLSAPTQGECKALVGWSITSGNSGEHDLGGRKVILAVYTPGPMHEGNWRVALYIDDGATVEDSILSSGVNVGEGAQLQRCIIDRNVVIPANEQIGVDLEADAQRFTVTPNGIVVVPSDADLS